MTHRNAPLSLEGRRRLVERCKSRAHRSRGRRDGHLAGVCVEVGNRYRRKGATTAWVAGGGTESYNNLLDEAFEAVGRL